MSGPRRRGALWAWAGVGTAGALALLGLWVWSLRGGGPPPPLPLQPPVASAPARHPAEPPSTPPTAVPVEPLDEAPSGEFLQRREAYAAMPAVPEKRPSPPLLRRKDPGIAPKTLSRQNLGRSAGKGVAHVLLVATYQGKEVSAPVEIDRVWKGNTPLSVTVSAGDHLIRIDHGRTRVNEFLAGFTGGRSVRMEVELRPASEARGNKGSGKPHRH